MPPPSAPGKTDRCPRCGSDVIDRVARQGLGDYLHFLIGRYPFRRRRCGCEFYLPQRGTGEQRS